MGSEPMYLPKEGGCEASLFCTYTAQVVLMGFNLWTFERFINTYTASVHLGKASGTSSKAQATQSHDSNGREV